MRRRVASSHLVLSLSAAALACAAALPTAAAAQPNPDGRATELARNNPCADPWVSLAVSSVKTQPGGPPGRAVTSNGRDGECDISHYNGGRWGSYAELYGAVRGALSSSFSIQGGQRRMSGAQFRQLQQQNVNGKTMAFFENQWWTIVAQGGGNFTLINQDGASIVTNASSN